MGNSLSDPVRMKLDAATLRNLYPINELDPGSLEQLAEVIRTETHPHGSTIFEVGDEDPDAIFLLRGELTTTFADGRQRSITHDCNSARYPVGSLLPRKFTATVASPQATIACVQRAILQRLLTRNEAASGAAVDVSDLHQSEGRDWMLQVMRSSLFQRLPTQKIEAFFSSLESTPVAPGATIANSNNFGETYYVIAEGECEVFAADNQDADIIKTLVAGESFGDKPLVTNGAEQTDLTIRMKTEGVLMRLSAQDFNKLLQKPDVRWITEARAAKLVRAKQASLVDIRFESEHAKVTIKGCLNAPLYRLRELAAEFDRDLTYIVFCATGSRSPAAAAILAEMGLDSFVLTGGLSAVMKRKSKL